MATALGDLMTKWQTAQEGARLSNIKRSEQITAIYDEIIKRYEPGGTFGKAALGQLEKQKTREVGGEMQQMISSGLYGTTTAAGAGRRWEESVGAPARLRLEDITMQRLSEAQTGKASFMERIDEPYPDYATMAGLVQQGAAGPGYAPPPPSKTSAPRRSLSDYMSGFDVRGGGTPRSAPVTSGVGGVGRQPKAQAAASVYATGSYKVPEQPTVAGVKSSTAKPTGGQVAPTDWASGDGMSPAAGYYAGVPKDLFGGGGDTSQEAYQAAKAAGHPWTYNYGTWKRAKASGKT